MKRVKLIILTLLALVAVLLPFVGVTLYATVILPPVYGDTFVGALDDKYERLNTVEGPKVVVVGGSSVAFGLDSEKLEEYIGMPVVNFGLYAALGTKVMLDMSESGIGEGDIVIISPELDPQTLSLYFSADTTLKAMDENFSMVWDIDHENWFNLLGGMWKFASEKRERYLSIKENGPRESEDIYQSKYFDPVYYDFEYMRPENVMSEYYDVNTPIYLDGTIVDSSDFADFAEYLNNYIKRCEDKGATVYFSYCPMNEMALTHTDEETVSDFDAKMQSMIDCEFITDIRTMMLDAGYFFDTNFHLNDAGVVLRTIQLAYDIKFAVGEFGEMIADRIPPAPPLPGVDNIFEGEDENAVYFLYQELDNGSLAIVGLSELGKKQASLTVPLGAEGKKVTVIEAGAFFGTALRQLTVTADSNLKAFRNGAFDGAGELRRLYVLKPSGDDINPPLSFAGAHADLVVYVPEGSDYPTHYYWSERGLNFEMVD